MPRFRHVVITVDDDLLVCSCGVRVASAEAGDAHVLEAVLLDGAREVDESVAAMIAREQAERGEPVAHANDRADAAPYRPEATR